MIVLRLKAAVAAAKAIGLRNFAGSSLAQKPPKLSPWALLCPAGQPAAACELQAPTGLGPAWELLILMELISVISLHKCLPPLCWQTAGT